MGSDGQGVINQAPTPPPAPSPPGKLWDDGVVWGAGGGVGA